jgi:hypothetical protein
LKKARLPGAAGFLFVRTQLFALKKNAPSSNMAGGRRGAQKDPSSRKGTR